MQMITKEQVEDFLKKLKEKIKVFDIVFRDDRGKNLQTLAALEIAPTYRKQVVLNIEPEDYVEGPIVDTLNKMGEMWVFGKNVKKQEVYIKIMLGQPNSNTICMQKRSISTHPKRGYRPFFAVLPSPILRTHHFHNRQTLRTQSPSGMPTYPYALKYPAAS